MRILSSALVCLSIVCQLNVATVAASEPGYPRLANDYLHGYVDPSQFTELAQWDLVILKTVWTEEQLAALRALNPDIRIYLYLCAYAVEVPPNPADPWNRMALDYAGRYDLWWYDSEGRIASDWPGSFMVNVIDDRPRGIMGTWMTFFESMVRHIVQDHPSIDGIFLDNFWKRLSWNQEKLQLDSDCHPRINPSGCDGVADDKATLDMRWNSTMRDLARRLRSLFDQLQDERGRPLTLLSNSSSDYFAQLNGTMIEFFPGGSPPDVGNPHGYAWRGPMFQWPGGYCVAPFRTQPDRACIINSSWTGTLRQPQGGADFERHKRFTLGSALLADGYYSLDRGLAGHGNLWWEPEYDNAGRGKGYLGQPTGPAVSLLDPNGDELVANGTFQNGLESWQVTLDGMAGDAGVVSFDQHPLLQLSLRGPTHLNAAANVSQSRIRLVRDQSYTLQLTARSIVPTDLEVTFTSADCPDTRCLPTWRFGIDNVADDHAVTFVSPADATGTLTLSVHAASILRLRRVSLRSGSRDLYRRDFEHGAVIVNATGEARMVPLGETLQRLDIPGSDMFDGRSVSVDMIAPGDAVIYLRPQQDMGKATPQPAHPGGSGESRSAVQLQTLTGGGRTTFRLTLPHEDMVHLSVFDVRGRLVDATAPQRLSTGTHLLRWQHAARGRIAQGIYLVRIETSQASLQRKVLVTR